MILTGRKNENEKKTSGTDSRADKGEEKKLHKVFHRRN